MKRISRVPVVLALFLLLFFPYSGLWKLGLFLLFVLFFSYLYSRITRNSLKIYRKNKINRFNKYQSSTVSFTVINNGRLPLQSIMLQDSGKGYFHPLKGNFLSFFNSNESRDFETALIMDKRGIFDIGPVTAHGSDPLVLFPWQKVFPAICRIIIYPAWYPLNMLLIKGETGGSLKVHNPVYEDQTKLRNIREYQPGDSLKRINWKASAKSGKLQTMEFSHTISASAFIFLNMEAKKYPLKHRYRIIERAIEAAASVLMEYGGRGQMTGFSSNGLVNEMEPFVPAAAGNMQTIAILEILAGIESIDTSKKSLLQDFFNKAKYPPSGTHLYIITPVIDKEILAQLEILRKKRMFIKLIYCGSNNDVWKKLPVSYDCYLLTEYGEDLIHEQK